MGQKVHPGGLRVGIIHDWKSNWYSEKEFSKYLLEDIRIRDHIYGRLAHAGLSDIHIRKDSQKITIDIYTARPGIVIGKSGSEVDALRKAIYAMTGRAVQININEIKRPELDAKLMAQSVAEQLQNRVSFRRAMKRSLASAVRSGAQGVKVRCGGRLGGTEMSRSEQYSEGRVPLHTLRADIDYGFVEAKTTYGRIGVKVWINKGEIMPEGYELTGAQTRLGRLLGVGLVGEDVDPNLAAALDLARHRDSGGFDLAIRDPAALHRLEAVLPERHARGALRVALHAAALLLAVLDALRAQHQRRPPRRGGPSFSSPSLVR